MDLKFVDHDKHEGSSSAKGDDHNKATPADVAAAAGTASSGGVDVPEAQEAMLTQQLINALRKKATGADEQQAAEVTEAEQNSTKEGKEPHILALVPYVGDNYCGMWEQQEGRFRIVNNIQALTSGLAYRYTKNMDDRVICQAYPRMWGPTARWGTTVVGVHQGDDWLKVEQFYLPMTMQGIPVVILDEDMAAATADSIPIKSQPVTAEELCSAQAAAEVASCVEASVVAKRRRSKGKGCEKCPKGHILKPEPVPYDADCNACHIGTLKGFPMWRCTICQYDLCDACSTKAPPCREVQSVVVKEHNRILSMVVPPSVMATAAALARMEDQFPSLPQGPQRKYPQKKTRKREVQINLDIQINREIADGLR